MSTSSSSATERAPSGRGSSGAQNIPKTTLEPVQPGTELPGGLVALYDGRGRMETPLWLPEQRALVFADALTAPGGELLVGDTPWHDERVLPALRALLALPFEHVVVSHSNDAPVHDRAAFERALERPPHSFLVLDRGEDVQAGDPLAAVQKRQLDQEGEADDLTAEMLDQLGHRTRRATGREHVVMDENTRASRRVRPPAPRAC